MTDPAHWLTPTDAMTVAKLARALRDATDAALDSQKYRRVAYENWCHDVVAAIPPVEYDRLDQAAARAERARQQAFDKKGTP